MGKEEVREIRLVLNNATERYKFFQEEHPGLENKIPQYHLASYLGVTPIQLSRIRAKMAGKQSSLLFVFRRSDFKVLGEIPVFLIQRKTE